MEASIVLVFHIIAGSIALISGTGAMVFRKGSDRHKLSGRSFVIAMLAMSFSGAIIAYVNSDAILSFLNGILTFYLVATAWVVVRRKLGEIGLFEWSGLFISVALCIGLIGYGFTALNSTTGLKDGYPSIAFFFFGSVAGIAVISDIKMIYQGGISGANRIVRHAWGMTFAFLIAMVSFFLGQSQIFPKIIQESIVLYVPVILVIGSLFYWLYRILFTKLYKGERRNRKTEHI